MTKISFYKINDGKQASLLLACKITAKAYLQEGMTVFIHTQNEQQTSTIDELLWSFSNTAFVPHSTDNGATSPIFISHRNDPEDHHGMLINLDTEIPPWTSRFERASEIVYNDQDIIQKKRKNFDYYKTRGYPLNFFDLSK